MTLRSLAKLQITRPSTHSSTTTNLRAVAIGSLALIIAAVLAVGVIADDDDSTKGRFSLAELRPTPAPANKPQPAAAESNGPADAVSKARQTRSSLARLITNPFDRGASFPVPTDIAAGRNSQSTTAPAAQTPHRAVHPMIRPVVAEPARESADQNPSLPRMSMLPRSQDDDPRDESSLYGDVTNEDDELSPSSLLRRDLTQIQPTLDFALEGIDRTTLPEDFETRFDHGPYIETRPAPLVYQWAPTNFYHYPLYFEDPALERYGHTQHKLYQPICSSGRFFAQTVFLPYQMTLKPVYCREYSLGWYRPGECTPKLHYQPVYNNEAAFVQTLSFVTLFLLIP